METNDYERIERAIAYLESHAREQPSLAEVAAEVHLSEFHFQRLFRRWAGVSPKRFLQFLTAEELRRSLRSSHSVLDAAFDAGLSGPGRAHDLLVNVHAMSPGEVKREGSGLVIRYGVHPSPFGDCLIGTTERGVCWLSFQPAGSDEPDLDELRQRWPHATLEEDPTDTGRTVEAIFAPGQGRRPGVFLQGTNFQLRVWEALLRIPSGAVVAYEDLARWLGLPTGARAVASAVAVNPVSYLVPCHRVIRKTGTFSGYRWGATRKRAIVGWEAAHRASG